MDDSILDRTVSPGAGATSYNLGQHAVTSRDIEAGEEIFLQYPEGELNHLSKEFGVPKHKDYMAAGTWVSNLLKCFKENETPWK